MGREFYEGINRYFWARPRLARFLAGLNSVITRAVFISYPVFIAWRLYTGEEVLKFIIVPGVAFVILSVFRKQVSFPRPYEVYDITPLNNKDTKGKSFPSRHVFSCFLIAMTFFAGGMKGAAAAAMITSVLLLILRVILGVHFLRDVLTGAVLGILSGAVLLLVV